MTDSSSARPQDVRSHCREIDRCNQRGSRMLSIVDLLDAGTVTPELAGYLRAAVGKRTSFMVGALPGGAGKTTVMGAMLNFVPSDVELTPTGDEETVREGLHDSSRRRCHICHEIGAGHYYAYLWGDVLTDLFSLPSCGHMVATNLHADTIDQARNQLCRDNSVPSELFDRFGLMLFLDVQGGWRNAQRRIATVWEPAALGPPRLVYQMNRGGKIEPVERSGFIDADDLSDAVDQIEALRASGARSIEQVRKALLDW